jgi:hypothetical protein
VLTSANDANRAATAATFNVQLCCPDETMSEHRYYEFRALDEPLSDDQQRELRNISSRADITKFQFVNEYDWGDLGGDPVEMLRDYFDVYLHVTNYGTRTLGFRLPSELVDHEKFEKYTGVDELETQSDDAHLLLLFRPYLEPGEDDWWRQMEVMEKLLPIREQLMRGDLRALYLGWLTSIMWGWLPKEATEPPVPAGLGDLDNALEALVDFLVLDPSLVRAAARESPEREDTEQSSAIRAWLEDLDEERRTEWLMRAFEGDPRLSATMRRAYRTADRTETSPANEAGRTVGEILEIASNIDG